MRFTRLLGGAAAAAVLTVPLSAGFVAAEEVADGRGTATAATSVLNLALGDNGSILDLGLLVDEATATIDDAVDGAPFATSRLTPVQLSLLGTAFDNLPTVETRTSGAEDAKTTDAVNLGAVGLPAVLSGTVAPASIRSIVDEAGARAGISSSVTDLTAAGGLVSVQGITGQLGASAADALSGGTRGVEVGAITLLDLGALLDGIGLPLQDLPLDVILGLLGELGLDVGNLDALEIGAVVDIIDATVDTIIDSGLALTTPITDEVCAAIDDTLGGVLEPITGQLPLPNVPDVIGGIGDNLTGALPVGASAASTGGSTAALSLNCAELVGGTLTTLQDLINDLRGTLRDLLGDTLTLLDGAALLSADGIKVGVLSSAADSVENSAAAVTAEIGSLTVGDLSVPGVDLGQTVAQVTGVVNQVNGLLGDVLGTVHPDLASLVEVSLFEELAGTGVTEADGYVKALAGLSALTVKVTPPSLEALTAIIGDVLDTSPVTGALGIAAVGDLGGVAIGDLLGSDLPVVGSLVPQLGSLLNLDLPLANPLTLQVASMSTGSNHTFSTQSSQPGTGTTPTGAPGGELPRTGGMGLLPAFVALAIGGAGLGLRRWLQSTNGDIS